VTQQVQLADFTREQLELFATELNLEPEQATIALDRIYHWTRGQPYLSQKLARQIARDGADEDVAAHVDHLATTQLAGRAALHSEPHMSHIHRAIVNDEKRKEPLLNLYGRIRKGMEVSADLGSALQRRLMAVGLIVIDHDGNLQVRNRLYRAVFTARWANENLPTRLRVPAMVVGVLLLFFLAPFWYTQWLPRPYQDVLTSPVVDLDVARAAYDNLRSFPGHADTADNLFRAFVEQRALLATSTEQINLIAAMSAELPNAGRLPDALRASFWDRQASAALREERRDAALLATLEALVLATPRRRQQAARLISDDYPLLLATLPTQEGATTVFDPVNLLLTSAEGGSISQWSYATQELHQRESWSITALEVVPLVRRVIVDREGEVGRVGLTLNISHARLADLRIKVIAPSGRTVEIETGLERSSSNDEIRIPAAQLRDFIGESLNGTWTISVRDEGLGVAGQLVGWNLKLNAQGVVEDFQRGLNIPDPVERETDNVWFDDSGRYAIARAMQSDSARIWDLAFAEPVRAVAVTESESLIGLDASSRRLVTATQDSVNLWDTSTGDRITSLPVGVASATAVLTQDGMHLIARHRGDVETRLELWSLEEEKVIAEFTIAGVPALITTDPSGSRVAVADYDRAVRIWDFATGEQLAQIDLPVQPSEIRLAAGGGVLGVVHGTSGVSLWSVARPQMPLLQEFAAGNWQLVFSPSGAGVLAGRSEAGFQVYGTRDGRLVGPPVGIRGESGPFTMLAFSDDEQLIFTGNPKGISRFWRAIEIPPVTDDDLAASKHLFWAPSADRPMVALPGAKSIAIGDSFGHVHVLPGSASLEEVEAVSEDVSFVGHTSHIVRLASDRTGAHIASAAADNSVRIWNADSGQPFPWIAEIEGEAIDKMLFSPDASLLAILQGSTLGLYQVVDGSLTAEFEFGEPDYSLAFATSDRIYAGGANGTLEAISHDGDGVWSRQSLWQGTSAIQRLAASPRGRYLVLVDDKGIASQFVLAEGHLSEGTIELAGPVEEITFEHSGSRAFFRTARWTHRASLGIDGLHWVNSVLSPKPLNGARIVLGPEGSDTANRAYLPAARNGFIELVELGFAGSTSPGVLGNKDELLSEWRIRLGSGRETTLVD
jgi:WD40 repeat protein